MWQRLILLPPVQFPSRGNDKARQEGRCLNREHKHRASEDDGRFTQQDAPILELVSEIEAAEQRLLAIETDTVAKVLDGVQLSYLRRQWVC